MVNIGVVGATGYTGEEIVRLLSSHPGIKIKSLSAIIEKPTKISVLFPALAGRCDVVCDHFDINKVSLSCELVFLALPHKVSMRFVPEFLKRKKKIIDLSADYRLPPADYKEWYGQEHTDKENIKRAIYGMPELYRNEIKNSDLIANPGCYPTSVILAAAPLVKEGLVKADDIIADSKTGVTGAGRKASLSLIYPEVNENLRAYKVNTHQHKPEINQELAKLAKKGIDVTFTPHLIPINRGILSTLYFRLKDDMSNKELVSVYKKFYKKEPFVRVLSEGLPQIRDVVNTNFCDIGLFAAGKRAIAVSCIDNLTKGAAGQAVQNMNIMCGFDEKEGLI